MNGKLQAYVKNVLKTQQKEGNQVTLSDFIAAFTNFAANNKSADFYSYADAVVHIFNETGEILKIESFIDAIPYYETFYVVSLSKASYKFEIKQNKKEFADIENLFNLCLKKHQELRRQKAKELVQRKQQIFNRTSKEGKTK